MKFQLFTVALAALIAASHQQGSCVPGSSATAGKDCFHYKVCLGNTWSEYRCHTGQYFNQISKKCELNNNGQCKIDNCQPTNPCSDICTSTTDSYMCSCNAGRVLNQDKQTCAEVVPASCSKACGTNRVCVKSGTLELCQCAPGYSGTLCQFKGSVTTSTGCDCVRGTCKLMEQLPYCDCPPGYAGARCEKETFSLSCGLKCPNRGKCLSVSGQPMCSCQTGYTGKMCDTVVNNCPFKNCGHGSCSMVNNVATCTCDNGYTGANCNKVSPCAQILCANGGKCIDASGTASCLCTTGFAGSRCQFTTCGTSFCEHGTCSSGKCVCKTGWEGTQCEKKVSTACDNLKCLNSGTCKLKNGNDPYCVCTAEYEGTICSIKRATPTGACLFLTCQNGGTCELDNAGVAKCKCAKGWSGQFCTTEVSCAKITCENKGKCEIVNAMAKCVCPTGIFGDRCQHRAHCNADTNSPCMNGGKCVNEDAGFHCNCPFPYTGITCDVGIKCADKILNCKNGKCVDKKNLATCECEAGYIGKLCGIKDDGCGGCLNNGVCAFSPVQNTTTDHPSTVKKCACPPKFTGTRCEKIVPEGKQLSCPDWFGHTDPTVFQVFPDLDDSHWIKVCQKGVIHHVHICPDTIYSEATRRCLTAEQERDVVQGRLDSFNKILSL